jgi:hypothetical protein
MKRLIPVLSIVLLMSAAYAEEKGENWEAKKQEQFGRMKEVKLTAVREKISIMQSAASCIQSAQNYDAAKSCDERERNAMQEHNQKMKERWESLKQR